MFIEKVQNLINQKGITMNKLAKEAGFSQASTDRWKKGSMPQVEALIKLCKYFNVSADYLLDLEDSPPPPVLTELEARLLEDFRQCSPERQQIIMETARSGAEDAKNKEKSLNLQKIG